MVQMRRALALGAIGAAAVGGLAGAGGGSAAVAGTAAVSSTGCAVNGDGSAVAGDLTGNGAQHTVVGLPSRGQIQDITATTPWHLTETHTNLGTGVDPAVGFGSTVVVANVNGDACADLLVGAPHTGTTLKDRGAVDIVLMTPTLPQTTSLVRIDGPQAGDLFGTAVTMTRRGADRDLWVGAPGYSTGGQTGVGAVFHYTIAPGSAPVLAQTILAPSPVAGDHFGAVLGWGNGIPSTSSPGNFDNFVVVGSPDRTVNGQAGAGEVEWIRSAATTGDGSELFTVNEGLAGLGLTVKKGDHFGFSLAVGGAASPTLIGIPGRDIGAAVDAGAVAVVSMYINGQLYPDRYTVHQSQNGYSGVAESGDQFGYAVAINDTYQPKDDTVVGWVGVPGEGVGQVAHAGQVQRFGFSTFYPPGEIAPLLTQGKGGLKDTIEANDRVGASLALQLKAPYSTATTPIPQSPVIGVPGEGGAHTSGAGIVAYGTDEQGLPPWRLGGYYGGAVSGLHFGAVLAQLA